MSLEILKWTKRQPWNFRSCSRR